MIKLFFNVLLCAAIASLFGCSGTLPSDFDAEKTSTEVGSVTSSLLNSMSSGDVAATYSSLLDEKVKEKMSLEKFQSLAQTIASKLGAFRNLQTANRVDFDPHRGGILVRTTYTAHFEKGDGEVSVAALKEGDQWRVLSFGVNSPLLSNDPANSRQNTEVYVANSDLVMPGSHVALFDSKLGNKPLIEDAVVLNVRWKVSASSSHEGFVTFALTPAEASAVKASDGLSIKALK